MRQGFIQTQRTVNKWITDFKKRIDGDDEEDMGGTARDGEFRRQNFGPSQSDQLYGIRKSGEGRRSGDRERYDADPHVLSDDFTQLELRDDEGALRIPGNLTHTNSPELTAEQQRTPRNRPAANGPSPTQTSSSPPPSPPNPAPLTRSTPSTARQATAASRQAATPAPVAAAAAARPARSGSR
ncbi:MAG: hypothetical protein INR71_00580 [Terriglobus roseus]|nr:hypothetical protein [Terriglobus roseus]